MPLRKVCRRPETDYRLQQLHAVNEAAHMDQHKASMAPANVHTIRVTSSSETVPKQQQSPNIPIVTQVNVSVVPQIMNVVPKKAETSTDVQAGNSMIPPGSAPFTSTITTGSVPEVPSQKMAEGK